MPFELLPPESATGGALPEVADLLGRVFAKPRAWLDDLRWQYLDNPNGPAWFVNARDERGKLVAHYGVAALPPLDDDHFRARRCFLSLNTAVDASAQGKGLFTRTAQSLFAHLQAQAPTIILGVANANSAPGFTRSLGFYHLGRLDLRFYPPFVTPKASAPRLLRLSDEQLRWRVARPGAQVWSTSTALFARIRHKGLPLDNVLTTGLGADGTAGASLAAELSRQAPRVPAARLYATFGASAHGLPVPDTLRPSPLHYICRPLPDVDSAPLMNHLAARRFEFVDFDVT